MPDRYKTIGGSEGEYQPGSGNQVMKNIPGITDPEEIENKELDNLIRFQRELFELYPIDRRIDSNDLCIWHKGWLGSVYEWAGRYRTVNLSKDGFIFAAAHLLPNLMTDYQRNYLSVYTPCYNQNQDELIEALAICHLEFVIIHPFRDGNGRLGRLLSTVMALQAGMPILNFESVEKDTDHYIAAIHAGHAGNYGPMNAIFSEVLVYSLQQSGRAGHND